MGCRVFIVLEIWVAARQFLPISSCCKDATKLFDTEFMSEHSQVLGEFVSVLGIQTPGNISH